MEFTVTGEVWEWRGPAPFHFVSLSPEEVELADVVTVSLRVTEPRSRTARAVAVHVHHRAMTKT